MASAAQPMRMAWSSSQMAAVIQRKRLARARRSEISGLFCIRALRSGDPCLDTAVQLGTVYLKMAPFFTMTTKSCPHHDRSRQHSPEAVAEHGGVERFAHRDAACGND